MELIPEWAPNLHPLFVHFPIALILLAVLMDLLNFFLPDEWWDDTKTTILYGIGTLSAIAAYYTGTLAADSVMLSAEAQPVLTEHADWAWLTVWFYGVYAVFRITATWWTSGKYRMKFHVGFFLVSLVGVYFLYQAGDHGAQMVFKHGVGVQAAEVENPVQHEHDNGHSEGEETHADSTGTTSMTGNTSFNTNENGNWIWNIERNAIDVLQKNFQWISGSSESVNAEVVEVENGHALSFSGDDLNAFFTGDQSYETEQIDYYVDMASFTGTVEFVSHIQDQNNYDFVSIASGGTVKQGRMSNGEPQIFEEGSVDVSQPLFVRVVGNGTHFRGYINKEMVVHGHGDAPKPGRIGLKMNGSGSVLLQKMGLTKL